MGGVLNYGIGYACDGSIVQFCEVGCGGTDDFSSCICYTLVFLNGQSIEI